MSLFSPSCVVIYARIEWGEAQGVVVNKELAPSRERPERDARDRPAPDTTQTTEADAFGALYRQHLHGIYRYLRSRASSDEEAADLTQQVFLKALDALPRYRDRGVPIAAWLFRIARNVATDAHRRRRGTVAWDLLPESLRPIDEDTDPEAAVLHAESLARLGDLLAALDPAKRELLALRFGGGLSSREIAAVVGKSEAAVKQQLARTLRSLKEQYHGG